MLWGFGNSLVNPALSAFTADIAEDEATRGQALSLTRQAQDAAFLLAPVGLGLLAQATDHATAIYASTAVIGTANIFFVIRATEPSQRGGRA